MKHPRWKKGYGICGIKYFKQPNLRLWEDLDKVIRKKHIKKNMYNASMALYEQMDGFLTKGRFSRFLDDIALNIKTKCV